MSDPGEEPRTSLLPWPVVGAVVPLLYLWIAWSWWTEVRTQLAALPEAPAAEALGLMAAAAVAARVPSVLSEAGLYTLWWKVRGLRLPYWRFVCWVAAFSTIDLLGFSIRRAAEDAPQALHAIAVVLAGPGVDGVARGSGAAAAFGSFGLLTVLRVTMTAWAQWRGIGRGPVVPLLVTVLAWLLSRVIAWWSVDLLRGMSPVP